MAANTHQNIQTISLGKGFAVKQAEARELYLLGTAFKENFQFAVPSQKSGWNLLGTPVPITLTTLQSLLDPTVNENQISLNSQTIKSQNPTTPIVFVLAFLLPFFHMKNQRQKLLIVFIVLILFSCGSPSDSAKKLPYSNSNIPESQKKPTYVIWKQTEQKWQAYSPNYQVMDSLKNKGFTKIESIQSSSGFWVNQTFTNHATQSPPDF